MASEERQVYTVGCPPIYYAECIMSVSILDCVMERASAYVSSLCFCFNNRFDCQVIHLQVSYYLACGIVSSLDRYESKLMRLGRMYCESLDRIFSVHTTRLDVEVDIPRLCHIDKLQIILQYLETHRYQSSAKPFCNSDLVNQARLNQWTFE